MGAALALLILISVLSMLFFFFFLKFITYMWSRRGIWYASANRSGFRGAGS